MLDSYSNPFEERLQKNSYHLYDDAREILLRQLKEHPLEELDTSIRKQVLRARVRFSYLDIEEIDEDDAPLWYAIQFGVHLPMVLKEMDGFDLETERTVSFDEVETWGRIAALGLPYRKAIAVVLAYRGFKEMSYDAELLETKKGFLVAKNFFDERIEALEELHQRIVRGTPSAE